MRTPSPFGRTHSEQSMTATSGPATAPTSSASDFDLTSLSARARALTRSFLQPFALYKRQPQHPKAMSVKSRIMAGAERADPIGMILCVSFAAVDVGIPWPAIVAWAYQYIQQIREYAERRAKRMGLVAVLPFPDRWARLNAKDAIEQGEAAAACWKVNGDDLESLERARKELCDEREVIDQQMATLDEKIAALRG